MGQFLRAPQSQDYAFISLKDLGVLGDSWMSLHSIQRPRLLLFNTIKIIVWIYTYLSLHIFKTYPIQLFADTWWLFDKPGALFQNNERQWSAQATNSEISKTITFSLKHAHEMGS